MGAIGPSALDLGLIVCRSCRLVAAQDSTPRCTRCGARLSPRKPDPLNRSWALLIAAAIAYVPANVLPVMHTNTLFGAENDTILSGIIYFWTSGSQSLALLIFTVSILIPILKILTMTLLALSVQRRWKWSPEQRARLHRIIEFIGRWSMLDIFVVALMVGMVRFRQVAVIEAGPGALAFGSVVVLTMLAARSFDPRLVWNGVRNS